MFDPGDMVRFLDFDCYGIIKETHTCDAGDRFYLVFYTSGKNAEGTPYIDISWEEDLVLISKGRENETR